MPLPMIGSCFATVNGVRPFNIHGDPYFEMHLSLDEQGGDVIVRVAAHAMKGAAAAGQRVKVSVLMGQVTEVESLAS